MASAEDVYREAQKRLHRLLGNYIALKAWHLGLDCVAIQRDQLLSFLQLERMKNARIDWLKEDLKDLFPHQWTTYSTSTKTYATLYLSRLPVPANAILGSMTDEKRVEKFNENSLKAEIIELPNEIEIFKNMALVFHGVQSITQI